MRIDFGRFDATMTEQVLDDANIGTGFQQMRGVAVAEQAQRQGMFLPSTRFKAALGTGGAPRRSARRRYRPDRTGGRRRACGRHLLPALRADRGGCPLVGRSAHRHSDAHAVGSSSAGPVLPGYPVLG